MPAPGGEPKLVAKKSSLVDWTRDGSHLLMAGADSQAMTLTAVRVQNGRAIGEPAAIRATLANGALPVTAPGGGLVVTVQKLTGPPVFYAALDSNDHIQNWQTLHLVDDLARFPGFSPDGRQIVYATGSSSSNTVVRLYTLATREDREVYRHPGYLDLCVFASAKRTIWCNEIGPDGTALLAIGADSGQAERVRFFPGGPQYPHTPTYDDRFLHITTFEPGKGTTIFRWEVGSDSETALEGLPSADSRWLLRFMQTPGKPREMQIRPTDGRSDTWRTAATLYTTEPLGLGATPARFTRDGNWIIYRNVDSQGKSGLYRVATSGGEPERLGDDPTGDLRFFLAVSPEGRHLIAQQPPGRTAPPEFWMLENFLPKAAAARQ
jgi:hypothetical protein